MKKLKFKGQLSVIVMLSLFAAVSCGGGNGDNGGGYGFGGSGGGSLSAPSNLTMEFASNATATYLNFNWKDNSSDETGFELQCTDENTATFSTIPGESGKSPTVTKNTTTVAFSYTAQTGSVFQCRIRAVSGSTYSEFSNVASATAP